MSVVVLVPVKPLALAKSRLVGLPDTERRELAAAFARDTVAAAARTPEVEAVLAVTDDHRFAGVLTADGCTVIPDGVTEDLNGSLRQAASEARRRWPRARPAALCADLPALRPEDLAEALRQARSLDPPAPAFVRDRAGEGTTLYTAAYDDFVPRFGTGSAAAHLAAGAVELTGELAALRQDVDDVGDLGRALVLGVGSRTAAATGRA